MYDHGRMSFATRVNPIPHFQSADPACRTTLPSNRTHQLVESEDATGRAPSETPQARIVALVPAHDEASGIRATLESLARQTRPADRVVVIADNCTDDTAGIAADARAEVFVTTGNRHKKAGALNQALSQILPTLGPDDAVLVMDADSTLAAKFLAVAGERLDSDSSLGAVGGVFLGTAEHGLVGQLQRNEYARYAREIGRQSGRVMVLTGTASLLRVAALRDVIRLQRHGQSDQVYDTAALTEDNELTLALKTLGWRLVSPPACQVYTDVMGSWRDLWKQRMRWQRGALENLRSYGFTRITSRYWLQQVGMAVGVLALQLYFLVLITTIALGHMQVRPFWIGVGVVFLLERLVTAWSTGRRGRLLAFPLVIELAYDVFLQAVFVRSLIDIALRREAQWGTAARRQTLAAAIG
jgi:cellulose synthase/poly-beta-1,6-N-acetylglucosamine synthase-like glycosyltransferase